MSKDLGSRISNVISGFCILGLAISIGVLFYVTDGYKKEIDKLNYNLYEATKNSLGKNESFTYTVTPNEYDEVTITKEHYEFLMQQSEELKTIKGEN